MRSPWLLALMLAVVIGFAIAWAPAVAQGPVAVGDNCFAVATRFDRSIHNGSGKSLQQAEATHYATTTPVAFSYQRRLTNFGQLSRFGFKPLLYRCQPKAAATRREWCNLLD
jgi:hypothetical protein